MINIEGILKKNDIGRWEFNDYELTSGNTVEIMIDDTWIKGRIEYAHDSKEYVFLAGMKETIIGLRHGMRARKFF